LKHLWVEIDLSGTLHDKAWTEMEQPAGFVKGEMQVTCGHPTQKPHAEGEWGEVYVALEETSMQEAVQFYKKQDRILAVELEEAL
jgi:hypothetical protein